MRWWTKPQFEFDWKDWRIGVYFYAEEFSWSTQCWHVFIHVLPTVTVYFAFTTEPKCE